MKTAFFATPAKQKQLIAAAQRWLGTPFHPHACIQRVGVDCVHLLAAIFKETGAINDWSFPPYTMDGGEHRDASQVIDWFRSHPRFQSVAIGESVLPGDSLCFRLGRVPHHVALAISINRFIHAMRGYGVIESQLDDPTFAKRLVAIFRPVQ